MTAPICANCDVVADLVGGLCPECVTGCYWIVRPIAHREMTRRRQAVGAAHYRSLGYEIITAIPDSNDEWYCDKCITAIVVAGDVQLIPALGSWAFCIPCVTRLGAWPDVWATPRSCDCLPCSDTPLAATAQPATDDTNHHQTTHTKRGSDANPHHRGHRRDRHQSAGGCARSLAEVSDLGGGRPR